MSKDEFIELAGIEWDDISADDYSVVEFVYSRHPAIATKQDIADLWKKYGMSVIRDMVETAVIYEECEKHFYKYMNMMNDAREAMENLKHGHKDKAKEYLAKYWKENFPEPEE